MAATARKPELKDFRTEGDSQGSVIDFQNRNMDYQKALREWESSQKGAKPANANKPQAIQTQPSAPAGPAGAPAAPGQPLNTSAGPTGGAPAAAGTGAPAAAGGFNLKTNVTRDSANESKGEFGSAQFEAKFNKIANRLVGMYNEQMPLLRNYDNMVQTQIDALIGETMPQVQEMFRQSGEQYGYAKDFYEQTKDFYEQSKGYDTAERREQERGEAMTDVRMAGEASRSQAIERLESFGVDPSQARGAALDQNLRLQTALAEAQAGTQAELGVEQRGRDYTAQGLTALGQGQGAVGDAARNTQGATTAGAGILEGNARAQMAAKQGAIQTGEAGANLLNAASGQIQSSANARQAKAASIAARQASKGPSGLNAAISGISQIGGTALAAYMGNPSAFMGTQQPTTTA